MSLYLCGDCRIQWPSIKHPLICPECKGKSIVRADFSSHNMDYRIILGQVVVEGKGVGANGQWAK